MSGRETQKRGVFLARSQEVHAVRSLKTAVEGAQAQRLPESMPKAFFSITRFPDRSLLKVSGRIEGPEIGAFARSLEQAFCFSAKPVVIDMRDVDRRDPTADELLVAHWTEACHRRVSAEVLLNAGSTELRDALRDACPW
jgi:hypothetical protein